MPKPLLTTFLCVGLLSGLLAFQLHTALGGSWIYPLDDTYIHLAIARNFAEHGVWGVTPHEFTSSSSSPLWTLLLSAVIRVFGYSELWPLLLNALLSVLLILRLDIAFRLLPAAPLSPALRTGLLLLTAAALPLLPLLYSGMEHIAQAWLTLEVFLHLHRLLRSPPSERTIPKLLPLALASLLLCGIRYEGLFLVGWACLLLLLHRQIPAAFIVGASALLIPLGYGILSLSLGWGFFPNSVLLKAQNVPGSLTETARWFSLPSLRELARTAHVWIPLFPIALLLLFPLRKPGEQPESPLKTLSILVLATLLTHLRLARVGWFFRYEAYLLLLCLLWLPAVLHSLRLRPVRPIPLLILLSLAAWTAPLAARILLSHQRLPLAAAEIQGQHVRMSEWVAAHTEPGTPIALNDIGLVSARNDIRLLDLWGLASRDVARAKQSGEWNAATVETITRKHGIQFALIYDSWVPVPETWTLLKQWTLPSQIIVGSPTVSIYSLLTPSDF